MPLTLDEVLVDTTITAAVSASSSSFGETLTFATIVTANVSAAGIPTGSVHFYDATTEMNLGTVDLLPDGTVSLSTASLSPGSHTISVSYLGQGDFLASCTDVAATILCSVYVLEPTLGGAMTVSGNASVELAGRVVVDSASSTALSVSGNAYLGASSILVAGGLTSGGNANFGVTPITGAQAVADPLASLAAPNGVGLTLKPSVNLTRGFLRIDPGIYGQIKVQAMAS